MNKQPRRHKKLKAFLYGCYLLLAVCLLLELVLRIYNPFHLRIKGDKILLPVNQRLITSNNINPRLDKEIINTRNSIGLRGPEPPADLADRLSVITVGGSTTECYFLNDDSTWPARLAGMLDKQFNKVWLNNAGLSGHSTFGHSLLLEQHLVQLRPRVILFLTGINDIENDGPSFHDKLNRKGAYPDLLHYIYNSSELVNLVVNLRRGFRAQHFTNTTDKFKPPVGKAIFPLRAEIEKRRNLQKKYLDGYRKRLNGIIDTCKVRNILPVIITQPLLYGSGIDSITHTNLATIDIGNRTSGRQFWELLEMYNDVVRDVAARENVPLIDLAVKMPKNSWYYYDGAHFTNEGAAVVASLIGVDLNRILAIKLPEFLRQRTQKK